MGGQYTTAASSDERLPNSPEHGIAATHLVRQSMRSSTMHPNWADLDVTLYRAGFPMPTMQPSTAQALTMMLGPCPWTPPRQAFPLSPSTTLGNGAQSGPPWPSPASIAGVFAGFGRGAVPGQGRQPAAVDGRTRPAGMRRRMGPGEFHPWFGIGLPSVRRSGDRLSGVSLPGCKRLLSLLSCKKRMP